MKTISKFLMMGLAVLLFCVCNFLLRPVCAQEAPKLSWHGYFGWNFQDDTKDSPVPNSAFDAFALSLIPKFTLSDKIDVYSQIVFEHAPFHDVSGSRRFDERSSGEIVLNDVYLTCTLNEWMKFRAGKFSTPFGFWNTLQYAGPTYLTIKQPGRDAVYARGSTPDTDSYLYGRYSQGAWLLGEKGRFSYDLYVANGKASSRAYLDDNEGKALGGRLGLVLPVGSANLKMIYSRYEDRYKVQSINSTTFVASASANFVNQNTNAVSADFTYNDLSVISEVAEGKKDVVKMNAFYVLAKYSLDEKWIPFLQYQLYEPNKDVSDNKTTYYTYGCAYQILPWQVVLKLQADHVKPESSASAGYNKYMAGLTAAF